MTSTGPGNEAAGPDIGSLDRLVEAARSARDRSYSPYSGFGMGAAVLCDDGRIVPGALVESISLGLSMCAERVALFTAVTSGAGRPVALALVARQTSGRVTTPCGACLQVAREHGDADLVVVCDDAGGSRETFRLDDLAPRLPLS